MFNGALLRLACSQFQHAITACNAGCLTDEDGARTALGMTNLGKHYACMQTACEGVGSGQGSSRHEAGTGGGLA